MKAIFSFIPNSQFKKTLCGFSDINIFLKSFVLSIGQAKKFFPTVEFYTNAIGMDLIEPLNLNIDSLINIESPTQKISFFPIAKFKSYELNNDPFIHLDYDFYMWEPPNNNILNSDVFVTNKTKINYEYQRQLQNYISFGIKTILPDLEEYIPLHTENIYTCNCGLFGSNNITFVKQYTSDILNYVNNATYNQQNHITNGIFLEQFYLSVKAHIHNIEISSAYENDHISYTHIQNGLRKRQSSIDLINTKIAELYPEKTSDIEAAASNFNSL